MKICSKPKGNVISDEEGRIQNNFNDLIKKDKSKAQRRARFNLVLTENLKLFTQRAEVSYKQEVFIHQNKIRK